MRRLAVSTGVVMGVVTTPAAAQSGQWAYCGGPLVPAMPASEASGDTIKGEADKARYDGRTQRYTFIGNASVRRSDRQISGKRLSYDRGTDTVRGEGDMQLREPGVAVEATSGSFRLEDDTGEAEDVRYRFAEGHLHGDAASMTFLSDERTRYQSVTMTTCNPGDEIWELRASEVTVDHGEGFGEAWNARLAVGGIPVAYTPWLRFPVGRERQTGFLAPSIGGGGDNGFTAKAPFYWNIAPNYDATITPTFFAERGAMLGTELRYLEPWIDGEIRGSFLPDDDRFGEDRWSINQEHRLRLGNHFRAEVDQERVSDSEYPDDFDTSFNGNTERFLESRGSASWTSSDWSVSTEVQNFQTVDETIADADRPLEREPSVRFRYDPFETLGPRWLDYGLDAEATRFTHPFESQRDTGDRFDTTARVSLPFETLGYFIEPAVHLRHTDYDLDRPTNEAEQPDRTVPTYTVDAGLFLERPAPLFGNDMKQTLEPRLFLAHTPERDQDDLPLFDTQPAQLTFGQLFRADRFTGADRVGDQKRASFGVTSRLVDGANGREYVSVSGGGIVHFDERDVQIEDSRREEARFDDDIDEEGLTALVSEAELNLPGGLSANLDGLLDPNNTGNHEWRTRLRYKSSSGIILNGRYRMRQLDDSRVQEFANASTALPVTRRWTLFGAVRFDLIDDEADTAFAGAQYEGCCFAVRGVYRSELDATGSSAGGTERDNTFMIELELKGLGGVGDDLTNFLSDGVPGYQRR
jgi:LPS-assembly protein